MAVQRNKLGITDVFQLEEVENTIVAVKLGLLDETITFGQQQLDLEYLQKLHEFLFGDIYYDSDLKLRSSYKSEELVKIEHGLMRLHEAGQRQEIDSKALSDACSNLWRLQLFHDGNARTVWGFMKTFIDYHALPYRAVMSSDEVIRLGENYATAIFQLKPREKKSIK